MKLQAVCTFENHANRTFCKREATIIVFMTFNKLVWKANFHFASAPHRRCVSPGRPHLADTRQPRRIIIIITVIVGEFSAFEAAKAIWFCEKSDIIWDFEFHICSARVCIGPEKWLCINKVAVPFAKLPKDTDNYGETSRICEQAITIFILLQNKAIAWACAEKKTGQIISIHTKLNTNWIYSVLKHPKLFNTLSIFRLAFLNTTGNCIEHMHQ